ncbi:hypothetical protein [Tahibacter harae]|uniref:Uncharacterized protein n=1 Tax=Tahibacter harae TaxID=2963937 RepID=A0ABT1QS81_9GAMM|nr:hypothetical protein [Tahibacter harae]MCQ4165122.1 hypothetical protein [Tahibacter harae]
MRELIQQLAREFVLVYEAVRTAAGEAAALAHDLVQAARRAWREARA